MAGRFSAFNNPDDEVTFAADGRNRDSPASQQTEPLAHHLL